MKGDNYWYRFELTTNDGIYIKNSKNIKAIKPSGTTLGYDSIDCGLTYCLFRFKEKIWLERYGCL